MLAAGMVVVALASAAGAQGSRVAILPSVIKDADVLGEINAQAIYDSAADALKYVLDLEPVSREEMESSFSDAIAYCGSDVKCISARLRSGEVAFAIELIVNQSLDPPLLTAQMIDTSKQEAIAREVAQIERDARGAKATIAIVVEKLVTATGRAPAGRLRVAVQPADATVLVEPAPKRVSEDGRTFAVAPGKYRIRAARDGYAEAANEVEVKAREESAVELALVEESSSLGTILLLSGIGAVAIGAGVAAIVLLSPTEYELCQGEPAACNMR